MEAAGLFLKARKLVETRLPYQDGHRNDHVYQVAHRCKERGLTQEQTLYFARRDFTDLPEGVDSAIKIAQRSALNLNAYGVQRVGMLLHNNSFNSKTLHGRTLFFVHLKSIEQVDAEKQNTDEKAA